MLTLDRYEFGFGLSYTTFNISSLSIEPTINTSISQYPVETAIQPGGNPDLYTVVASVSASISNTGDVAGAAVPQLYVSPLTCPANHHADKLLIGILAH